MNKIGIGGIEKVVGWMDGWKVCWLDGWFIYNFYKDACLHVKGLLQFQPLVIHLFRPKLSWTTRHKNKIITVPPKTMKKYINVF